MAKQRRKRAHAKRLRVERELSKRELWEAGRSGSHAGRGFHYQDRIATELTLEHLAAGTLRRVIPEGLEDISLETDTGTVHVQAKSRREQRGDFRASDLRGVFAHLAMRLVADPGSRAVLVLERAVADWQYLRETLSQGRAAVAGSDQTLATQIRAAVTSELAGINLGLDEFLERLTIEVHDGLPHESLRLLSTRLDLPPASCQAHHLALQDALSTLADLNGERDIDEAASLTLSELLQLLERISEQVDPSALLEPVRDGICELVDFQTAIADAYFYDGVDALPGHVVAGLTLERPDLTAAILEAARERGVAMVVGPSGAGKSALLWLTAWESREEIAWYRLKRLRADDVTKLVRFARGTLPTAHAPLGFVVDDLGRPDTEGWDNLVRELRSIEHVQLIGACREEDLIDVGSSTTIQQVRPRLDEKLAVRLYDELRARNATSWGGWREPYAASNGLLLEYGHLLTAGERMQETIREQIDQRRRGRDRETELEVLRIVATADSFGADIDATRLQAKLSVTAETLQRTLLRLIDEHLISERNGRLAGLHALRSRAICLELHRLPPMRLEATAAEVIELLEPLPLQTFLTQLLATDIASEPVLDALGALLFASQDADTLTAALQALRVSGFATTARTWAEIMREEEVAPMHASLLSSLALLPNTEIDMLTEEIQRATRRMREAPVNDLRPALLDRLDTATLAAALRTTDATRAAELLAALAGTNASPPAPVLADLLREAADLEIARKLLEAAYALSPELAGQIVDELGGSETLLNRLEDELPWVRNARLDRRDANEVIAAADYAWVAQSIQTDPHGEVVELCRYLLALVPEATIACSRALDATGELAGFGVPIADTQIPRANLPSGAAIAWNRSIGRALTRAIAAQSSTERLVQERDLLVLAADVVAKASRAYLLGDHAAEAVAAALVLALSAETLLPPPEGAEHAAPLELGSTDSSDPVGFLATMIPNNLVERLLNDDTSVGPFIPQLLKQLDDLSDPARWALLDRRQSRRSNDCNATSPTCTSSSTKSAHTARPSYTHSDAPASRDVEHRWPGPRIESAPGLHAGSPNNPDVSRTNSHNKALPSLPPHDHPSSIHRTGRRQRHSS